LFSLRLQRRVRTHRHRTRYLAPNPQPMEEPLHLTLRQFHAQCLATPRGCFAERAKALRSGVLDALCLLVGGQPRAHGGRGRTGVRLPPRVRRVSSSSPPVRDPVRHL
jgi:hypothetical protein